MKRRRPAGSSSSVASRLKERVRVTTQHSSLDPIECDDFDDHTRAGTYGDDDGIDESISSLSEAQLFVFIRGISPSLTLCRLPNRSHVLRYSPTTW